MTLPMLAASATALIMALFTGKEIRMFSNRVVPLLVRVILRLLVVFGWTLFCSQLASAVMAG